MPRVVLTPRAVIDLERLSEALRLPPDVGARVQRSLRLLERFPQAGRQLTDRWSETRFLIGPWPWMILIYLHDDVVFVVAVHDARSSSAATGG